MNRTVLRSSLAAAAARDSTPHWSAVGINPRGSHHEPPPVGAPSEGSPDQIACGNATARKGPNGASKLPTSRRSGDAGNVAKRKAFALRSETVRDGGKGSEMRLAAASYSASTMTGEESRPVTSSSGQDGSNTRMA
jgi:hypothetical protein